MNLSEADHAQPGRTENILEIRDTSVTFEMDRGTSRVLNNVTIDVHRQEILGIVGESGSGKSMFASALLDAVVDPGRLSGEITYYPPEDDPVSLLSLTPSELKELRWEEISMVFQGALSSFNPTMDIRGHFLETLDAHGYKRANGLEQARELLSDLYLDPDRVLDSYPHELSGGMKQRALIALAMLLEPNVLVMDEPTAALDLLMQRSIISLLEDLQEKYDLTIVFITHDLPLVAGLADRIAVMYAFEMVELGPSREILKHAAHPYARSLLKAVPNMDVPIEQMRPIDGSSPDPVNVPQGCPYHPRCPLSDGLCEADHPDREPIDDRHEVACFHWEEAESAVPYDIEDM